MKSSLEAIHGTSNYHKYLSDNVLFMPNWVAEQIPQDPIPIVVLFPYLLISLVEISLWIYE